MKEDKIGNKQISVYDAEVKNTGALPPLHQS
jgi:hypothetical protein